MQTGIIRRKKPMKSHAGFRRSRPCAIGKISTRTCCPASKVAAAPSMMISAWKYFADSSHFRCRDAEDRQGEDGRGDGQNEEGQQPFRALAQAKR